MQISDMMGRLCGSDWTRSPVYLGGEPSAGKDCRNATRRAEHPGVTWMAQPCGW